jgi:hypothetical protein
MEFFLVNFNVVCWAKALICRVSWSVGYLPAGRQEANGNRFL